MRRTDISAPPSFGGLAGFWERRGFDELTARRWARIQVAAAASAVVTP